jgi:hypothetical protein
MRLFIKDTVDRFLTGALRVKNIKTFVVFFVLIFSGTAFAASITAVKNKRVMINLEGMNASVGSEFYAVNPSGKKVAILRVSQVKGGKAVADITKGSAQVGYSVQGKGGGGSSSASSADSYYDKKLSNRANTGNSMGLIGGYLMNTMSASFIGGPLGATYPVSASMSGSGLGVLGFYDYAISPRFILRGMAGLEQYNVTGSITTLDCGPDGAKSTTCDVKLTYLSFYGYARYNVLNNATKWWVGGGYGYLYAMAKSSSVLKSDQISANQLFVFSTGVDFRMSPKTYIPVSLEYGMFPSSDSVKANIIYLRAGYAWNL